jgi:hypothetical protein
MPQPYVRGAGPLPNDEYGDGNRQVNPAFSRRTNMNIANRDMTDGNLSGVQSQYGTRGVPSAPYTDGPGLGPRSTQEFKGRGAAIAETMNKFTEHFGPETASQILDELMRIAASEDVNGRMKAPSNARMFSESDGHEGYPSPDFGDQHPYTTREPTDGNLMGLEEELGYPPRVSPVSRRSPVRNSGRVGNVLSGSW